MNAGESLSVHVNAAEAEFRRFVDEYAQGARLPRSALNFAVGYFLEEGHRGREDVEACVRLARCLAGRRQGTGTTLTPAAVISREHLTEGIRPEAEQIRHALFRSGRVPFRSLAAAARWIERQGSKEKELTRAFSRKAEDLAVEIAMKIQDLQKITRREMVLTERPSILRYLNAKGRPSRVVVPFAVSQPPLGKLQVASRLFAAATGFSKESVVAYILTGAMPSLPAARVSWTYRGRLRKEPLARKAAVLELLSRDITLAQLRDLHRTIRGGVSVGRVRPLTGGQADLVAMVLRHRRERRGSEQQTSKGFWEGVQDEWNRTHPEDRYKTWRGLETRYGRLRKQDKGLPGIGAGIVQKDIRVGHSPVGR